MKLDKLPYQQDAIKAVVEAIGEVCANEESRWRQAQGKPMSIHV